MGYNWQFDHAVAGLEGSLDGTNLARRSLLPVYDPNGFFGLATPGGTLTTAVKSNLQGSLRTRLGYAWGRLLPFVTGGFALGGLRSRAISGEATRRACSTHRAADPPCAPAGRSATAPNGR